MVSLSNSLILIPSINISPFFISYNFINKLNIVDLPAPLLPTKPTVSLALILNERLSNTFFLSYENDTFLNSKSPFTLSICFVPKLSFVNSSEFKISNILLLDKNLLFFPLIHLNY